MRRLLAFVLVACSGSSPPPLPRVPDASKSSVSSPKTSGLRPNELVQVDVVVRDAMSEPIAGATMSVTFAPEHDVVHGSTNESGGFSFTAFFSDLGRTTVTVNADDVKLGDVSFDVIPGPAFGFQFVTQPPASVKAGSVFPPLRLRIVDAQGNTTTDAYSVSLRLTRSTTGGTLTGGALKMAVDGGVTFDTLSIDRPQVACALRAESPTGSAGETELFDVLRGDPDMGTSTLVAMPASLMTGASTTLTLTVRDVAGNALSGQSVMLSVSGTGNTVGASSGTSGGDGTFTTSFSSTVAETKTVTATVGSVTVTAMVTFTP